ncbi:uncharacterized protein LOC116928381 isoform X2 [Daphnia magna]|uniref:uncharacterized protein LOC116928381 isoform X2 n=1 Tax=Daphnia magna TaxID=35525 RepID=UPI0006E8F0EE|nr:uncharacterized protein LOC116928381 isoform X2 [Daphnia magna]
MGNHQRTLFSSCFTSTRKRTLRVSAMYYEVEKIIDKKLVAEKKGQKRVWYFVKFKGYPPEANEWVSAKHSRMERLVREFHAAQKAATVLQNSPPPSSSPLPDPNLPGKKNKKKRKKPEKNVLRRGKCYVCKQKGHRSKFCQQIV